MSNMFEVGKTYNFDVFPSKILGNTFKNMVVVGILDHSLATKLEDTYALHENIKSYVPGLPNSPTKYSWVRFKSPTDEFKLFGLPWIRTDTISLVDANTIQVTIKNVSSLDIPKIRDALSQNGFSEINIEMLS